MDSQAVDLLEVKQKRRIYDITNVLEGIGLIEKESKNSIRWKFVSPIVSYAVLYYTVIVGELLRDLSPMKCALNCNNSRRN